jgi:AraC family transcriptional activator of pobA
MKIYSFPKDKHNQDIQIECIKISSVNKLIYTETPFTTNFFEVVFITEGFGTLRINNIDYHFKKGCTFFLTPSKLRNVVSDPKQFEGYILLFEEQVIANFFHDSLFLYRFHFYYNNEYPPVMNIGETYDYKLIFSILENMYNELQNIQPDSQHFLRAQLYYTLVHLNRLFKTFNHIEKNFFDNSKALQFKKLLENNVKELSKVMDYAELMGISTATLNNITKVAFGKHAGDVIKERRIAEAMKLILFSNMTFAEVAYHLNYSEPSNFSRNFKSVTGLTPDEFKKNNQSE